MSAHFSRSNPMNHSAIRILNTHARFRDAVYIALGHATLDNAKSPIDAKAIREALHACEHAAHAIANMFDRP